MAKITEQELDALLKSVEAGLNKAVGEEPEAQAPAEAPAEQAPAEAAPEAPAEGQEPKSEGTEPHQEPDGDEMGEMSDEELQQIYASMPPEELEKHFMIIRSLLMQRAQEQAPAQAAPEQAPAQAAPEQAPPAPPAEPEMGKSESMKKMEEELTSLKSKNEELSKAVASLIDAVKIATKPVARRAVATASELEVITKSEDSKELSDDEIKSKLNEVVKRPELTKSERDIINSYCLTKSGKDKVLQIIGGKK